MKRLLIFFLLLFSLARGEAQTTTTSDRVVTKSLYLRDWWVDSVKRDTNFLGAARSIPTAAAVYNFVAGRGAPGYTSVTALPDSSGLIFHGPNGVQDTVVFEGETASGGVTQATLDDSTSVLRDSIDALRADIGSGGGGASYTPTITTQATSTTLSTSYETWVFTGSSAATFTLPAISGDTGRRYYIKNQGSANLTVQRAGTDQLYTSSLVNSITILPGGSFLLQNNGTNWTIID